MAAAAREDGGARPDALREHRMRSLDDRPSLLSTERHTCGDVRGERELEGRRLR
jgi:hypothetical protein